MENRRHWKWYFKTYGDAKTFYTSAAEIARKYTYVTLEDLYDLAGDSDSVSPLELLERRSVEWDFESINPAVVSSYVILAPASNSPSGYYVTFYEIERPATEVASEPINVTINIPNVTRAIIVDLMREANSIKDRPVFITINATE